MLQEVRMVVALVAAGSDRRETREGLSVVQCPVS